MNYKSSAAQGQENRRPLLHRIFGANTQNTKQPASAVVGAMGSQQSNSVGPASRAGINQLAGGHNSFIAASTK